MAADISLGTANGARAVFYVCSQLQALPALRPLVLAVKAFLRQRGLNEVTAPKFEPSHSWCRQRVNDTLCH